MNTYVWTRIQRRRHDLNTDDPLKPKKVQFQVIDVNKKDKWCPIGGARAKPANQISFPHFDIFPYGICHF